MCVTGHRARCQERGPHRVKDRDKSLRLDTQQGLQASSRPSDGSLKMDHLQRRGEPFGGEGLLVVGGGGG